MTKYNNLIGNKHGYKHGDSSVNNRHRLYTIYGNMKQRCNNPNATKYKNYGGRGIKVLFKDYPEFKEWSLANGYSPELTIDRKDNDGNYEPSNCRWITYKQQSSNQRPKHNKTRYPGIRKVKNKYYPRIYVDGKQVSLGGFDTPEEACQVYLQAKAS